MAILGTCAIIATIINLWYCYYERIENFFWNWPAYGFIAIGMFLNHAYANAFMQVIQAGISTYGFFIWTRYRKHNFKEMLYSMVHDKYRKTFPQPVIITSTMSLAAHFYSLIAIFSISFMLFFVLDAVNDISPFIDGLSFTIPLVASIQLNYKKIESWIYLAIGDVLSVFLAYKAHNHYNLVALLLFLALNLICFKRWLKNMQPC